MYKTTYILVIVQIILTINNWAWTQECESKILTQTEQTAGGNVIKEEVLLVFADEPYIHFNNAREDLLKKDLKGSVTELRKSKAFLELETSIASKELKKFVTTSNNELENLADSIENGVVVPVKDIDETFIHNYEILAIHHYLKASEHWINFCGLGCARLTGYHLRAVAMYLENALTWTGNKLEASTAANIKDARTLSENLIGGNFVLLEVDKCLESLDKEIDKLSTGLECIKK